MSETRTIHECLDQTIAELNRLAGLHDHWRVAWSLGKDSSTVLTVAAWAIEAGHVAPRPRRLVVDSSDTTQELSPLYYAGEQIGREAADLGWEINVVRPDQDKGLWVIPADDERRIRELVAANTWPRGWDGTEPGMDEPMHTVRRDGSVQLNLLAGW